MKRRQRHYISFDSAISCASAHTHVHIHMRIAEPPSLCLYSYLLGVSGDPLLGRLLIRLAIVFELVCNTRLHCIIRLRGDENLADKSKDILDAVGRLPRVAAEDAQTHGAFVVVGDIGMVDFGPEGDDWRLERILFGKFNEEGEFASLYGRVGLSVVFDLRK